MGEMNCETRPRLCVSPLALCFPISQPGPLEPETKKVKKKKKKKKANKQRNKKKITEKKSLKEKKKIRKKEKVFSPSLVIQTACSNETSDLAYRCPFYLSLSLYLSLSDISSQFLFVVVVCCCYLREKKTDQNPPKKN